MEQGGGGKVELRRGRAGKWREGGVKEEGRTCSLVISCFVTSFAEILGSYAESV